MSSVRRSPRSGKTNSQRPLRSSAPPRLFEPLEARQLLSVSPFVTPAVGGTATPAGTAAPTGFSPAQIRHAYGFDQITGTGQGQTIAIVDAFLTPTMASDLHQFDLHYGLTDPTFQMVNENGKAEWRGYDVDPAGNWQVETALDVEWAHAVAPDAKIILVVAQTSAQSDLMAAVNTARYLPGVSAISMSFGRQETPVGTPGGIVQFGGQTFFFPASASDFYYNRIMLTPAGHQPETFIAASGDFGVSGASFPATSPNVLSVGGTHLTLDSSNNYVSESVWIGSQGGESSYQPTPAYQGAVSKTRARATPDVSYNADNLSGVSVYSTTSTDITTPIPASQAWLDVGGTSAGSPQWAGLVADVNQMRASAGLNSLDGVNETLPALYQLAMQKKTRYQANFNDIATGQNGNILTSELPTNPVPLNTVPNPRGGGFTGLPALPGYDMATGLGTPKVASLASYLSAFVPVKVVHRSAKRRAAAAAAVTTAAAKATKSSPGVSPAFVGAFAVASGETLSSDAQPAATMTTTPAPAVAAPQAVVPPAFVIKHLDASVAAAYPVTLAVSAEGTVTTQIAASRSTPVVASPAEVALTSAFLTAAPVITTDDTSSAVPAAATEQQTAPAAPAVPAKTRATPAGVPAVVPSSDQAPAATPADDASSANVDAAVVIDGAMATANAAVETDATQKPTADAKAFKPSVPMLVGVVAADAVVLSRWFQRRAEAKRRKAAGVSFGLTLVTPQDDDQVC